MIFTWDEKKNQINKKKHRITFEEAQTVFKDDDAILFDDPEHSSDEARFLIIGCSQTRRICIVSHCYLSEDEVIRIISARIATKIEILVYQEGIE